MARGGYEKLLNIKDNSYYIFEVDSNEDRGARAKDTGVSSARYLGDEEDDFMSGVTTGRP